MRRYILALAHRDVGAACAEATGFAYRQLTCYVSETEIPPPYAHVRRDARGVRVAPIRLSGTRATTSLTGRGMRGGDGEYTPQRLELRRDAGRWKVRAIRVPLARRGVGADIGEGIIGTPYREVVRRYGPPESIRRHGRETCGVWDSVGDPYDWEFCFRRGVMTSAIGGQ